MNDELVNEVVGAFLASSLPIDPTDTTAAAEAAVSFYKTWTRPLPEEEVADRFNELWKLWFQTGDIPPRELRELVRVVICVDPEMTKLASEYFKLIKKLEEKRFMKRAHAVALVGCAPLIRTLVADQHLGLNRIRSIINVPGATFEAIKSVLGALGISAPFTSSTIGETYKTDSNDVSFFFGDTPSDESEETLRELLGSFARSYQLWEAVTELVYIGFEPYLFMLYFELLTLETTDRFPGQAVYESLPRGKDVKALWNAMYNPTQENPYLNNAKSVFSLDTAWAETKSSNETQNGALLLATIFEIMAELPYTTRRRIAHVVRCYLVHVANERKATTPLSPVTPTNIRAFIVRVAEKNSMTKGVLDQRLVDFLTMCIHSYEEWTVRGLGSSVNEANSAGKKFGDVEYTSLSDRNHVVAYEAHGGGLRDEYVQDHLNSLGETIRYYQEDALDRGERYSKSIEIVYVAHDVSGLQSFQNGYSESFEDARFELRFKTFHDLLQDAGGLEAVVANTKLFEQTIHQRMSNLPDSYTLKQRYKSLIDGSLD